MASSHQQLHRLLHLCEASLFISNFWTKLFLFSASFRSVVLNKEEQETRGDGGLLPDCLCWVKRRNWCCQHGSESDKSSWELHIHSLRMTNQTTLGQYFPFLFPLLLQDEKRKLSCSFSSLFPFCQISDGSTSNPRDTITCLFGFTSSLCSSSSTFRHFTDKSIYAGGSQIPRYLFQEQETSACTNWPASLQWERRLERD